MTVTIEVSDDLAARMDNHLEDDEDYEELIAELLTLYESEGQFYTEGYTE